MLRLARPFSSASAGDSFAGNCEVILFNSAVATNPSSDAWNPCDVLINEDDRPAGSVSTGDTVVAQEALHAALA